MNRTWFLVSLFLLHLFSHLRAAFIHGYDVVSVVFSTSDDDYDIDSDLPDQGMF